MADNAPVTPSGPPLSDLWDHHGAPTDQEVLDHIRQTDQQYTPIAAHRETAHSSHTNHRTWESPPNRLCSASFGDEGMTATVNAYGLLMQFGDYLGVGRSGLFSADHSFVDEPYQTIDRAETLDKVIKQTFLEDRSYGLSLGGLELGKECAPRMSWKNWRWPCYEYGPGCFSDSDVSLTVEWMVHKKTLLQRCTVDNHGPRHCNVEITFLKDLRIQDLDHTGNYADPRLIPGTLDSGPGPGRYTWLWRMPYSFETTVEKDRRPDVDGDRLDNETQLKREAQKANEGLVNQKPGSMNSHQDRNEVDTQFASPQQQPTKHLQYFELQETPKSPLKTAPRSAAEEFTPTSSKGKRVDPEVNDSFTVVVVAAVFVNGEPQRFESEQNPLSPSVWAGIWHEQSQSEPERPPKLEIVTAYQMLLVSSAHTEWKDLIIPAKVVEMELFRSGNAFDSTQLFPTEITNVPHPVSTFNDGGQMLDGQSATRQSTQARYDALNSSKAPPQMTQLSGLPTHSSSPACHLNYVMWRNLEHILSVCSIPVGPKTDDEIQPVALTCGDMSLHRVCNSASFFALSFLLETARRLAQLTERTEAISSLENRIRSVALGHIKWLLRAQKVITHCFAANYWVTGRIYPNEDESDSWHADGGATDTPFQIIKAAEVFKIYPDETAQSMCQSLLSQVKRPWLDFLSSLDPRVKFAWPHAREEGIYTFRLDDHVWIWRALKALDSLHMWESWTIGSDKKIYSIADIQKEILQRFTTKIDESGKRMLAVTRSARENRFLLHARDSALFYEPNLEFFQLNPSYRELWENTIDAQPHHEDNRTTMWDNAIRYALTVVGAASGLRTNTYKEGTTLVRDALITLFQTTSPNGFFPGQLDENVGECPVPVLYDHEQYRDFYFHAHFEICYILLVKLDRLCDEWFEDSNRTYMESPDAAIDPGDPFCQRLHQKENAETVPIMKADIGPGKHTQQDSLTNREAQVSMKKSFPLGSSLDTSKIVDIDEEWLYEYPIFFKKSDFSAGFYDIPKLIEQDEVAVGMLYEQMDAFKPSRPVFKDGPLDLAVKVFDVSKKKHIGKRNRNKRQRDVECTSCDTRKQLWDKLAAKRTAEDAKKRFIVLANPKIEENLLICYLTTPWSDQIDTKSFFSRHSGRTTFFNDYMSKVYNDWHTELILNFDVLVKREQPGETVQGFAPPTTAPDQVKTAPCSLGFLFKGDIFDRHWTCYLLGSEHLETDPVRLERDMKRERDWRQRKILELLLLSQMIRAVSSSANLLLGEFNAELDLGVESFSTLSSEEYLRTSHERLQRTQEQLESVDTCLSGIIDIMAAWNNRELDRAQQPRWTRNDERKYRESINHRRLVLDTGCFNLRQSHADTQVLRDKVGATLTRNLANIAEGRSLRESENMRLFTYVTVVFLPLGFAASVFSMAGTPDTPLLVDMVICAVVALFLTVLMLINAQGLANMAKVASSAIHKYSKNKMERSLIVRHRAQSRDEASQKKHQRDSNKSWFLWFWVKYLIVELPARRVIIACRLLNFPQSKDAFRDTQSSAARSITQDDTETVQSSTIESSITSQFSLKQRIVKQAFSALQILGGLVSSPLFVSASVIQLIVVNMWDLSQLLRHLLSQLASSVPTAPIDPAPEIWFISREEWRPIKRLDKHVYGGQADVQEDKKSDRSEDEAQTQTQPQPETTE